MSVFLLQMCETKLCKSKMYKLEKNTEKKKGGGLPSACWFRKSRICASVQKSLVIKSSVWYDLILVWICYMLYLKKERPMEKVHSYGQQLRTAWCAPQLGITQRKDHDKLQKVIEFMMSDALIKPIDWQLTEFADTFSGVLLVCFPIMISYIPNSPHLPLFCFTVWSKYNYSS